MDLFNRIWMEAVDHGYTLWLLFGLPFRFLLFPVIFFLFWGPLAWPHISPWERTWFFIILGQAMSMVIDD